MRPCIATLPSGITLLLMSLAAVGAEETWLDKPLADYLAWMNREGLRILYTSDLVREEYRFRSEPVAGSTPDALRDALAPFGLSVRDGPGDSLIVVALVGDPAPAQPRAGRVQPPIPEIVVSSSLHRLEYSSPQAHTYLDSQLATRVPATADEALRLTQRLPGTSSGGVSAQSHVRGGEVNEVLFLFDGLRIYEPYHLRDFQAVTSIVNSAALSTIDFHTGAFPARYGDRMSGVMSIGMREIEEPLETELALSLFNTSLLSAGRFGSGDRGEWLVTSRRGNLDIVADIIDPDFGSPNYNDHLGHVAWEFGPRAQVSANVLVSSDKLALNDAERGERANATSKHHVGWVKWQADWTDNLSSDSIVAYTDIDNRRRGSVDLPGIVSGSLDDERGNTALELRQDWRWLVSTSRLVRFGWNLRELDADYRFVSDRAVAAPFDTILDNQPLQNIDLAVSPSGVQYAAYGEYRWRPGRRWTTEIGLRWDLQSYTAERDDKQLSPRASLLFEPDERTAIRIGWGRYFQAQEINELQVSDGVAGFFPAQRSEHFIINVRRSLGRKIDAEISAYRKSFERPRPRFENRFNPLTLLPELQFDRERIDPFAAEARGIELLLSRGAVDDDLFWWLGYTWSESYDRTAGGHIPRSWDQTHTLKSGISRRFGRWDMSAAFEAHSGWPRSVLSLVPESLPGGGTRLVPVVSARGARHYAHFNALDVRISRDVNVSRGELTVFFEASNLYNRKNPCCVEYSMADDGSLVTRDAHWLPLVPSIGVHWRF